MNICIYCSSEFTPDIRHPNSKRCPSKQCAQKYKNEWGKRNPEGKARWVFNNPDKRAASSKAYTQKNKPYYAEYSSLRTRKMQMAKPPWADTKVIGWFYEEAEYLGLEVDHIIPITHRLVCGLHVPANLQLLSRSANAKKSNKFNTSDEDVVCVITKKDEAKDD